MGVGILLQLVSLFKLKALERSVILLFCLELDDLPSLLAFGSSSIGDKSISRI